MNIDDDETDAAELLLDDTAEVGFADDAAENDDETIISFSDDEQEEETPLVKNLRDQLRAAHRANRRPRDDVDSSDPEPTVPDEPSEDDAGWDFDKFREAMRAREKAVLAHADWKSRQAARDSARNAAQAEQSKRVEQQKNALGIKDYDARSDAVQATLSEQQLAVLINAADDPARMIAALGAPGATLRLTMLAGESNLAKFAAQVGKMEKEVKVTKRTAPPPETQVRGATASLTQTEDKHLAKLEAEAAKTLDRSKIAAYRREQRQKAAA